jgi:Mg-chelatase subunit ChlD
MEKDWINIAPVEYLVSAGLSRANAECVVEAAGIESMMDLALLANNNNDDNNNDNGPSLLSQVVQETGLKLIPAKKLSDAVKALAEKKKNNNDNDNKDQERSKQDTKDTKDVTLDECVVIAIDRSGSMGAAFEEAKAFGPNAEKTLVSRSRMDAVKQCFYVFRDRTEALLEDSRRHSLGLIQFDDRVLEMLPLTVDLDLFEAVVDDIKPRASTAIYSAVLHGCRMLEPYYRSIKNPNMDLRILVLTDGQNNAGVTPQEAFRHVAELGVVVDAILVGNVPDQNLRKIVAASGGTCFQITSLSEGFELMEAEAVVSLKSRRGGGVKPKHTPPCYNTRVDFVNISVQPIISSSGAAKVSTAPVVVSHTEQKWVHSSSLERQGHELQGKRGPLARVIRELLAFSDPGIHIYQNEKNVRVQHRRIIVVVPNQTAFFLFSHCLHAVVVSYESPNGRSFWDCL